MSLVWAALVSCGFQPAAATQCVDAGVGVRAVTSDDQRAALIHQVICARPETGEDLDPEDPALLIFWDEHASHADAMVALADERAGSCNR